MYLLQSHNTNTEMYVRTQATPGKDEWNDC